MEKMNINGTEIIVKRDDYIYGSYGDTAKWALNKIRGKVIKEKDWDWMIQNDYDNLNRFRKRWHSCIAVADKKPEGMKLEYLGGGYRFKAYEFERECKHYNSTSIQTILLVVPHK